MFSLYASRLGLLVCAIALVVWTAVTANEAPVVSALLNLRFTGFGASGIGSVLVAAFFSLLPFMLLGAFAGASLARAFRHTLLNILAAWCIAIVIAALCLTAGSAAAPGAGEFHAPGLLGLIWPGLGTLIGSVFGGALRVPPLAALRSTAVRLVICALAFGCLLLALRSMLFEAQPAALPIAHIRSADKRDLVELARIHNPFRLGNETTQLFLPPQHVGALLAWGVSIFNPASRARLTAQDGALQAEVSLPTPERWRGNARYLNASLAMRGVLTGKAYLRIEHCRLRIGHFGLQDSACSFVLRSTYAFLTRQASIDSALNSLHRLSIGPQGISAQYAAIRLDPAGRDAIHGLLGPSPVVQAGIIAQLAQLRANTSAASHPQTAFEDVLKEAFALARERAQDTDAVSENQAAILALATVLGHHDIATLGGFERPPDLDVLTTAYASMTLRNRQDWRKHFLVSAALTQISSTNLSDATGLLKEELDAVKQTGGFSFGDLQMDRAGTVFGDAIARNPSSARSMQQWLATRFDVECIAPPAEDMPEDISDAELQRRFGGVGGAGYKTLINEIERRVNRCAVYRS